tara:strand:+ start:575 stop:751 length:177 start_codon:yes stop_codon:yes gene_type:complete
MSEFGAGIEDVEVVERSCRLGFGVCFRSHFDIDIIGGRGLLRLSLVRASPLWCGDGDG